jgi:hypothetical protein
MVSLHPLQIHLQYPASECVQQAEEWVESELRGIV